MIVLLFVGFFIFVIFHVVVIFLLDLSEDTGDLLEE
jgi:hypothetical protein